jgi:DNA-binding MarR family transcriptional regulator
MQGLLGSEKRILATLKNLRGLNNPRGHQETTGLITIDQISRISGLTESTIIARLPSLCKKGLITKLHKKNRADLTTIEYWIKPE